MEKAKRARHRARRFISEALAPLALSISACGDGDGTTDASDVSFVDWTSSFGFCRPDVLLHHAPAARPS